MQLTQLQRSAAQAIVSIFETGRPTGGYGQVTVLQGDTGRLTYGRFQTTLGSGALYFLIKDYVERPGAIYVSVLAKYLDRLLKRDWGLDHDRTLHRTLKAAGDDPVMRQAQDDFFERNFWTPAVAAARGLDVTTPLGVAVIYDSKVHGSFERVRDRTLRQVGPPSAVGEEPWISAYVANRRAYLAQHAQPILRKTVYRMAAFERLIRDDNWDLDLPFKVGRFRIDEKTLRPGPAKGRAARILVAAEPPMKGDDVREVQARLRELGYGADPSGAYDDATVELVRKFQAAHGLKVDGAVGPATRAGLDSARPRASASGAGHAAQAHTPAHAETHAVATAAPEVAAVAPSLAQAAAPAAAGGRAARAIRRGSAVAGVLGNLAPWFTRYSLAPVAAIGALSAGASELRGMLPDPETLKQSSSDWIASAVQPAYEWFIETVPVDATRMLALAALLWVLVAVGMRRRSGSRRAEQGLKAGS